MTDEVAKAPSDEMLLDGLLKRLKATGQIEYRGEYGPEITTFIPLVSWLKEEGHLAGRRVVSYAGMAPYYFFLEPDEFVEKNEARHWVREEDRDWPTNSTYTATLKPWHRPPDFRRHYAPAARRFSRPTLFIQNKFTVEWFKGPINYLPLNALEQVLTIAADRFQVVYSRPGAVADYAGYSADQNAYCQYPDLEMVRRFPGALVLEEMVASEGRPYNELKLEILAGAHLFLATQGGSAHILAAFGNSLLVLLHRTGPEYPHAYQHGPYQYLSPQHLTMILAYDDEQLADGIAMFENVEVLSGEAASA